MNSTIYKILTLKGYPIASAEEKLRKLKAMSSDEFFNWQERAKWEQVQYHFENTQWYRDLIGTHVPNRWDDIPLINKSHLQFPLESIVSSSIDINRCYLGSTSGSTGTPFKFAKDKMCHAMTWAIIKDRYLHYGLTLGSKQARFYGAPSEIIPRKKEELKDKLMNRIRFSVFDLTDNVFEKYIRVFAKNRFEYIYGYTSALVLFARYLISRGIVLKDVCKTVKVCISTSETCTGEDHELLEKAFGISHIREYGVSELCIVAFDNKHRQLQLNDNTLYTENYNDEIVATSLFNHALPMIKYQTGDVGDVTRVQDIRFINKLEGRTNDVILLPNGKCSVGLAFYYIARSFLEKTGVLKEFIVRQVEVDKLVFDINSEKMLTKDEQSALTRKVHEYLDEGFNVIVNHVNEIKRPASGKLKHFYSELN